MRRGKLASRLPTYGQNTLQFHNHAKHARGMRCQLVSSGLVEPLRWRRQALLLAAGSVATITVRDARGDSVFPRGEHRCSSRQHWKQPYTHGREHTREWRTRSMSTESRGRVARTICTLRRGHTWPRLKSYTVRVAAMTAPARCAASSGGWRIDGHGTVPRGRGIGLNRNVWLMTVRERCTLQRGICRGRCPWRRKRRRENSVPSCAQDSTPVK